MKKWILAVVVIVLLVVVAIWGKQYYENRYVGTDYYAMIPIDFDLTPEPLYSMSGEEIGIGKSFKLIAFNEQGEPKTVEFTVHSSESSTYRGERMPKHGDFLLVNASKQIVVGWNIIDESKVPAGALGKIKTFE